MAGNDLGALLGGLLGGGQQGSGAGGAGHVLGSLLGALTAGGSGGNGTNPLGGLLDLLTGSGLADQTRSWVGSGANQPVSGAQIAEALPADTLRTVAAESGMSPDQAAHEIARSLPQVVDRLSPAGSLPRNESLEDLVRQQNL
ncbi:YidB family protein [Streptomyces sp. NPDC048018]|uniref:YidB family protein n=1 Tax=Streptomyces sp. NPDC048018 TaxID=3365499 RepID=UPI0037193CF7